MLTNWLTELANSGRVRVPPPRSYDFDPADVATSRLVLADLDANARLDAPFHAPPLVYTCAGWATLLLYSACQFLVYRDVEAEVVRAVLAEPCPDEPSPGVCYSVDLVFRHLPELISLARGVSEDDPLVVGLMELSNAWPLSSVGVKGLGNLDASVILGDPCLRRLYADRIIERADVSRLGDPRVVEAVRESIGAFPTLAPGLAAAILPPAEIL